MKYQNHYGSNCDSLIEDVVNNLDNKDFKTIVSGTKYDLKNAYKFLLEIINKKITENETRYLYNNLIARHCCVRKINQ